jgi:hypothetical protein
MFAPKTVFVIGAGGSCDLGLPTGDALRLDLISMLARDGDNINFANDEFDEEVRKICYRDGNWLHEFSLFLEAADRIRAGLPFATSIDNFLDAHPRDEKMKQLGKMAIASTILNKEANSSLAGKEFVKSTSRQRPVQMFSPDLTTSWYAPLMRLLVTGRNVHNINSIFDNVAFIVFNYDRCLEHFLYNAVRSYFGLDAKAAAELVNGATIIHPYGQVGRLHWQTREGTVASFASQEGSLSEIAEQIQTFTESVGSGIVENVKRLIGGAETLALIGFGFLRQNIDLLTGNGRSHVARVFASAYGIGPTDISVAVQEIERMLNKLTVINEGPTGFEIYIEPVTCRQLLDNHRLRLTTR